jgi:hypothetical protein
VRSAELLEFKRSVLFRFGMTTTEFAETWNAWATQSTWFNSRIGLIREQSAIDCGFLGSDFGSDVDCRFADGEPAAANQRVRFSLGKQRSKNAGRYVWHFLIFVNLSMRLGLELVQTTDWPVVALDSLTNLPLKPLDPALKPTELETILFRSPPALFNDSGLREAFHWSRLMKQLRKQIIMGGQNVRIDSPTPPADCFFVISIAGPETYPAVLLFRLPSFLLRWVFFIYGRVNSLDVHLHVGKSDETKGSDPLPCAQRGQSSVDLFGT